MKKKREVYMFLKKLDKKKRWKEAYVAEPKYFKKSGNPIGVFALTEDTDTILPLSPQAMINGKNIENWELLLVSLHGNVIGRVNYYKALVELKKRGQISAKSILISAMDADELRKLYSIVSGECKGEN